jgi:hypothetical protein
MFSFFLYFKKNEESNFLFFCNISFLLVISICFKDIYSHTRDKN